MTGSRSRSSGSWSAVGGVSGLGRHEGRAVPLSPDTHPAVPGGERRVRSDDLGEELVSPERAPTERRTVDVPGRRARIAVPTSRVVCKTGVAFSGASWAETGRAVENENRHRDPSVAVQCLGRKCVCSIVRPPFRSHRMAPSEDTMERLWGRVVRQENRISGLWDRMLRWANRLESLSNPMMEWGDPMVCSVPRAARRVPLQIDFATRTWRSMSRLGHSRTDPAGRELT
jgi:hypothetical protein